MQYCRRCQLLLYIIHYCELSIFLMFQLTIFRINTPKKQGGLGTMKIPLLSDTNRAIAKEYGVLKEDEGIAYR